MKKYTLLVTAFILFIITGLTNHVMPVGAISGEEGQILGVEATPPGTLGGAPLLEGKKVEYVLPYPGMLPDHPLYNLKRLRDYILERLITDPVRKSEFYRLQGDKRLGMGIALFDQKKGALGETTISKAEKYLEKAMGILSQQKKSGAMVPPFELNNMEKALQKHEEVIVGLMTKASEAEKASLSGSLTLVQQLLKTIGSLRDAQ